MPVVLVPLIGFALLMAALGVLTVHHSNQMWLQPLLERMAHPKGSFLTKLALAPVALAARGVIKLLNYVRGILSHWAAAHLAALTSWFHGLTHFAHLAFETTLTLADDTLHALSILRHHTIPHLIHAAVAPVAHLAHVAERDARRAISLVHKAERDFTVGIDRLGHRLEHFVLQRVHGI